MKLSRILAAAALLSFPLLACTAAPAEDVRSAGPRLTIVEADGVAGRLTAIYHDGDRAVRFEVRRGVAMQAPYLEPSAPITHEMDGRVLDEEGQPFLVQFGGDRALDPTWRPGPVVYADAPTRLRDMQRAVDAAAAFAAWDVSDAALVELRATAIEMARVNGDKNDARPSPDEAPELPTIPAEGPTLGTKGTTCSGTGITARSCYNIANWSFAVWKKSAAVIAEHSAVMLRGHKDGDIVVRYLSCNHGACAGASNMDHKCSSVKYADDGSNTRKFYTELSDERDSVTGGCLSAYDAIHAGSDNGHNCHNDTRLQRYAIRYDHTFESCTRYGTCGELCNDMMYNAPDCY